MCTQDKLSNGYFLTTRCDMFSIFLKVCVAISSSSEPLVCGHMVELVHLQGAVGRDEAGSTPHVDWHHFRCVRGYRIVLIYNLKTYSEKDIITTLLTYTYRKYHTTGKLIFSKMITITIYLQTFVTLAKFSITPNYVTLLWANYKYSTCIQHYFKVPCLTKPTYDYM